MNAAAARSLQSAMNPSFHSLGKIPHSAPHLFFGSSSYLCVLGVQVCDHHALFLTSAGDGTQGFVHARPALYQLSYPPSPGA